MTVRRFFDTKDDIPESMRGSAYALTKLDAVKSLISYAVGCMFGRYSLYQEGLVYSGGEFTDAWEPILKQLRQKDGLSDADNYLLTTSFRTKMPSFPSAMMNILRTTLSACS